MNINLTPYWEKYIQEKVASGRYNNASEVVREALRSLEYVEDVRELRDYAREALAPENRDRRIKAGPDFMAEIVARVRSGEQSTEPLPRYLTPAEGTEEPVEIDEEPEHDRHVAEPAACYRIDGAP